LGHIDKEAMMSSRALHFVPIAFALSLFVATAHAGVPDPTRSSSENVIVGDSNGLQVLDGYRVTVRDIANVPLANSHVTLTFAGTVRPYTVQVAPAVVTCPTIMKMTDAAGNVVFQPRFGGFANANAVQVRADGVLLNTVLARSTDLNADGKTDVTDLVLFRQNYLFAPASQETDYDETGLTDLGDLAIFRSVYFFDVPGVTCP